jgi:hypothetical protein
MTTEKNRVLVHQLFAALNGGPEALAAARPAIFAPDEVSYFANQRLDY